MNLDRIQPNEIQVVLDGEVAGTKAVSPDASEVEVVFTPRKPGVYSVELATDEVFPDDLEHLRQQDGLEFSNTSARIEWEVTVEGTERLTPESIWRLVKELAAAYTVLSIARKTWRRVKQRFSRSDQNSDTEDDENPNLTLDDFREK